jgi:hypothetical protein
MKENIQKMVSNGDMNTVKDKDKEFQYLITLEIKKKKKGAI